MQPARQAGPNKSAVQPAHSKKGLRLTEHSRISMRLPSGVCLQNMKSSADMNAINHPAARDLFELLAIPGVSTEETAVSSYVENALLKHGLPPGAIARDRTYEQSEYGGKTGNLIVRLPRRGKHAGAPRLFMTHLDTVELCRGAKPRMTPAKGRMPARIVNDNPQSALGADCRTGVAVVLHAARHWAGASNVPPMVLVFTVQEELGLIGSRGLDFRGLGPDMPVMGFNFDGHHPINEVVSAMTGTTRFFMELHGRAAHTGINPEAGVSVAVAASNAISELAREGWHGAISRPEGIGSANIGIMNGGKMTNTVMDHIMVRGEARSHDARFRRSIVDRYRSTFEKSAASTKNVDGECARLDWKLGPCYESFAVPADSAVARAAGQAIRALNMEPVFLSDNGGCDANNANLGGIPTLHMGTGQRGPHTTAEWIDLDEFVTSCRLAELLVEMD
jgi:tripeptide aminopeptidase